MARATLGASAGKIGEPAAGTPGGMKPIGLSGHLSMDEAALLGYGSNGTMVFKGTWDATPCAVKRMHIAFVEMVDAEMKVLLDLVSMHRRSQATCHYLMRIDTQRGAGGVPDVLYCVRARV